MVHCTSWNTGDICKKTLGIICIVVVRQWTLTVVGHKNNHLYPSLDLLIFVIFLALSSHVFYLLPEHFKICLLFYNKSNHFDVILYSFPNSSLQSSFVLQGTQIYDANKGAFKDLGILDVMQIFGRAGRPQFDTFGEGTIITTHDRLSKYLALMTRQNPIESQFQSRLADNLNAEVK